MAPSSMQTHAATEKAMLDDRGYSGHLIRGQPPGALLDPTLRHLITRDLFWKEQCFALNEASLLDRAVQLTWIGGTYHNGTRASPFLCLAFKMLQLGVSDEILSFYLEEGGDEFKYLRALAAFYIRLTRERDEEVYKMLEPYLADFRKLRTRDTSGWGLTTVDEFVDRLLAKRSVCSVDLWMLIGRERLEDEDRLDEREIPEEVKMLLDEEDEEQEASDADDKDTSHMDDNGPVSDHEDREINGTSNEDGAMRDDAD